MTSKAIATHSLFLIGSMALFLIFTIIIIWPFLKGIDPTPASCTAKYLNYCERWRLNGEDPGDWKDIEPKGCEDLDINRPGSLDEC